MDDVDERFALLVAPLRADRGLRARERVAVSVAVARHLVWIVVLAFGALGASLLGNPQLTQDLSKALRTPVLW